MSYKDVQLSLSSQANATKEEVEDKEGTETRRTAQAVQKAVNLARKADVRHKKSVEELAQCKRLWGEYQRQMREAYSKEFAQHKADVEKYELEVKKNKEASEMAAVRMRQVLLDGEENQLAEPVAMECVGEDPDPWEDLLQGTAAEEETADKEVADYLQSMLRAAQETRQAAKLRLQDLAQGRPTCRPAAPKATPTRSLTGEGPPYQGLSPNPRRTLVEDPYGTTTPARGGPPAGRAAPDALLPVTPNKDPYHQSRALAQGSGEPSWLEALRCSWSRLPWMCGLGPGRGRRTSTQCVGWHGVRPASSALAMASQLQGMRGDTAECGSRVLFSACRRPCILGYSLCNNEAGSWKASTHGLAAKLLDFLCGLMAYGCCENALLQHFGSTTIPVAGVLLEAFVASDFSACRRHSPLVQALRRAFSVRDFLDSVSFDVRWQLWLVLRLLCDPWPGVLVGVYLHSVSEDAGWPYFLGVPGSLFSACRRHYSVEFWNLQTAIGRDDATAFGGTDGASSRLGWDSHVSDGGYCFAECCRPLFDGWLDGTLGVWLLRTVLLRIHGTYEFSTCRRLHGEDNFAACTVWRGAAVPDAWVSRKYS